MNRSILAVALVALAPLPLFAGKVKTVTVGTPAGYEKAQFSQTVVSNEGAIRLARWLKPLPTNGPLDAARVWDVAEDRAGNLYVATGDDGRIFKITSDGQVSVAHETGDGQVLCLLVAPDGSIYAGTGPSGRIIRIDPAGKASLFAKTPERYIWALAADEKGQTLFAATGPNGRVYKVDADGKAAVYFQSKQEHVLCLARGSDGTLYAGTDKQGVLYRIDSKGKGYVLFQAAQAEVRCLQLIGNALYVGTSSPTGARSGSGGSGATSGATAALSNRPKSDATRAADQSEKHPADQPKSDEKANGEDRSPLAPSKAGDRDRESDRPGSTDRPSAPGGGENSVYRVGLDGSVREMFREKGLVLSLLKLGDRLYVGTGSKGQLFEISEATREKSEIARLDHGQIQRLFPRRDGSILLAAGDPGKLFVLQNRYVNGGNVVGEVIDAKLASRWGAISWQADVPASTKLTVAVRGGNVAEPDDTWSDWSAEQTDPANASAAIPTARYAQFRLTLATSNPAVSPTLQSMTLRYATLNQAPEVTSLDVPNLDGAAAKEPKKLHLKWSATDANEDELVYDLFVRKEGWKEWVKIEDGLSKTEYEWDTTTMPSGMYQVKVVASDRPDNNEDDALTGERISTPVAVAHEAPNVTLKVANVEKGRAAFEAAATSTLVRLTSATYALDGGKWVNVYPLDGLFDSRDEKFKFASEALTPGAHVMVLRVRDAAGNTGSADVIFTVPKAEK